MKKQKSMKYQQSKKNSSQCRAEPRAGGCITVLMLGKQLGALCT